LGINNLVASVTPQQSTRGFVAPAAAPVKKTPDISDIRLSDMRLSDYQICDNSTSKNPTSDNPTSDNLTSDNLTSDNLTSDNLTSDNLTSDNLTSDNLTSDFPEQWRTMFEQVFASVPTIYIPLKELLPKLENNIIKVVVKNDIQKEHFEAKTRDVLAFLRTHYNEQIEDIVVETNEKLETKKIIYDVKDKLQNFKEQNEEFEDFLHILDLKIKD
jgi:hypothetical protein